MDAAGRRPRGRRKAAVIRPAPVYTGTVTAPSSRATPRCGRLAAPRSFAAPGFPDADGRDVAASALGVRGFSLMEVMIALAIVGILATLAVPALFTPMVRDQVAAAAPLVDLAKKPIAAAWAATQSFPANNAAAGLPAPDKIVNNYVSSVAINDGVIEVTFGNNAHKEIRDKVLTIRPAVVEDAPVVPVAWVCGYAGVPARMTARGANATTIAAGLLPFNCQPPPK